MPGEALDTAEHLWIEAKGNRRRLAHGLPLNRGIHQTRIEGMVRPEVSFILFVLKFGDLVPAFDGVHRQTGLGGQW